MQTLEQAHGLLATLTDKQREVLDLVLEHKSSKEIARALRISPYTVDQRLSAVRHKLGVATRGEVARSYAQLRELCGETAYGFSHMAETTSADHHWGRDQSVEPVFMLSDAAYVDVAAPWQSAPTQSFGLEAFDNRFGVLGRVCAIFGLAAAIALAVLAMVAIAETMTKLI